MTLNWHFVLRKHQKQELRGAALNEFFGDRGKLGIRKRKSHNKKNLIGSGENFWGCWRATTKKETAGNSCEKIKSNSTELWEK